MTGSATWHRVAGLDELPEGRVKTVVAGGRALAISHHEGRYGALDNRCPHQGGPLGEGSIENGWLRCPWHGYDYDPLTGTPPPPFNDRPPCFTTEVRSDGVYVELPPVPPAVRTVSEVLVETMCSWGIDAVFGMVGHSNLGFAEAMRRAEDRGDLRFFGIRHEGAASFAAGAYGKLTGRPAACFAIAGPGSTNLLTGLYDAKVDRAPVLAVTGQVPSALAGRGAFQDLDLEAAFADVAAYSQTVHAGSNHAELMTLACKNAIVERAVGHLVLPDEVQVLPAGETPAGGPAGRVAQREVAPPAEVLAAAAERIAAARRPLIIVGAGARFDMAPVIALAERIAAPVATTFKAKGQVSDRHPLGCGVLGRSGTPIASWFMNESDLIVAFGASFSNHTGIAPYKPIVQVDFDPMALGRFHPVDIGVLGGVGVTAEALGAALDPAAESAQRTTEAEVAERWALWRAEKASRVADDRGRGVNSAAIFDSLGRLAPADAVISVDVGNNTYSFGRYFEVQRQSVLMSGYLGSIGFGFPAAMGAWAAVGGERSVLAVTGDGGFGQYAMELTTAVKYGMNITHVLLNNNELGKITKEQLAGQFGVWHTSLVNPSFAAFAELCGAHGTQVTDRSDLDDAIAGALAHPGPALVEVLCDPGLV
ncbi:MAG: thiamine pyrophosphate-binding protein [bacterium]|nr:thiamine pyrophosphate-binding protein [bacterium]